MPAGQPQRRHGGFGARTGEAHPFDVREQGAQLFGQHGLAHAGGAERQAIGRCGLHGPDDGRMGMADDGRAPGAHIIDVALALHVPHPCALGALDEARGAAHGPEGPHGRVDPANQHLAGTVEFLLVGLLRHGDGSLRWFQ